MARSQGRAGRPWRTLSALVFAEETTCWLCGKWVDQTLTERHRLGRTVDHLIQLCHGGPPLDRDNCRLAHRACNTARSNRLRGLDIGQCACSLGIPCGPLTTRSRDRGQLIVDVTTI